MTEVYDQPAPPGPSGPSRSPGSSGRRGLSARSGDFGPFGDSGLAGGAPGDADAPPGPARPTAALWPATVLIVLVFATAAALIHGHYAAESRDRRVRGTLQAAGAVAKLLAAAVVESDLVLMERLAVSDPVRGHLRDPGDPELAAKAKAEFLLHQPYLRNQNLFWSSADTRLVHSTADPVYHADPAHPSFSWYDRTLDSGERFFANTNFNPYSGLNTIWINIPVMARTEDGGAPLGLLGSAVDFQILVDLIDRHLAALAPEIAYYVYSADLEVTAAPDKTLVFKEIPVTEILPAVSQVVERRRSAAETRRPADDEVAVVNGDVYRFTGIPGLGWTFLGVYPASAPSPDDPWPMARAILATGVAAVVARQLFGAWIAKGVLGRRA